MGNLPYSERLLPFEIVMIVVKERVSVHGVVQILTLIAFCSEFEVLFSHFIQI